MVVAGAAFALVTQLAFANPAALVENTQVLTQVVRGLGGTDAAVVAALTEIEAIGAGNAHAVMGLATFVDLRQAIRDSHVTTAELAKFVEDGKHKYSTLSGVVNNLKRANKTLTYDNLTSPTATFVADLRGRQDTATSALPAARPAADALTTFRTAVIKSSPETAEAVKLFNERRAQLEPLVATNAGARKEAEFYSNLLNAAHTGENQALKEEVALAFVEFYLKAVLPNRDKQEVEGSQKFALEGLTTAFGHPNIFGIHRGMKTVYKRGLDQKYASDNQVVMKCAKGCSYSPNGATACAAN